VLVCAVFAVLDQADFPPAIDPRSIDSSGQRRAREDFGIQSSLGKAPDKFSFGQNADHGGIIRAKALFCQPQLEPGVVAGRGQLLPESAVASHAAGSGDARDT
jgi:hypothetical protein